jgi:hypothetical protein
LPDEGHEIILAADVLYERRLVPLVCELIQRMLAPGGQALLAGPYRVATEDFVPCLRSFGLHAHASAVTAIDLSGHTVRGTLHRVVR